MLWFGREKEAQWLQEAKQRSLESASQLTVLSGPRRVGKTTLVQNSFEQEGLLYFYVSKKSEADLCAIFQEEIEEQLHVEIIGELTRFEHILKYLMQYSQGHPLTLFIDEFQEFRKVDESIYGDIQKVWDKEKKNAHMNLVVAGSAKTMLLKLFEKSDQPLYGRQTQIIRLEHFYPSTLKEILSYYHPQYKADDLLALYSFTGGVARYVEILMDEKAYTKEKMIRAILKPNSIFILEAKNHIAEEFGKDADVYFQILSAIATGHTGRNQIEDVVGKEVSGYLTVLDDTYGLVHKHQPLFAANARSLHYELWDNFYIFWFRYIYRYNYMVEIGAWEKLQKLVSDDYPTYSGKRLERYFRELLIELQQYTRIDTWWSRNGEDEIDLIAIDEMSKKADFFEVKRTAKEFDPNLLEQRKSTFLIATRSLKGYNIRTQGLSMENM